MNNHVAEPFKDILANINMGIKAGIKKANKKPLDGLFAVIEGVENATDTYIRKLKERNEILERENKLMKKRLRRFGQVFDNFAISKEINDEIKAERGKEVEINNSHEIDEHEEELIEKNGG